MIGRRGFITGLISLVAAPAIVRVTSLMPVKAVEPEYVWRTYAEIDELYGHGPMMNALPWLKFENSGQILTIADYARIIAADTDPATA